MDVVSRSWAQVPAKLFFSYDEASLIFSHGMGQKPSLDWAASNDSLSPDEYAYAYKQEMMRLALVTIQKRTITSPAYINDVCPVEKKEEKHHDGVDMEIDYEDECKHVKCVSSCCPK